jgi:hypothetical protein
MPFNVQEFRASLVTDGARASLFDVMLTFPLVAATGGNAPGVFGSAAQQVTFRARSTSLPGDSISSIGLNYFGREIKIAGNRTFPDWSFTVINDEDFTIRNSFERWMSGINSHVSNLRMPALISGDGGYQQDAVVTQYSKIGEPIKQYRIVGAFPTDVSAIDLDWGADNVEEFAVTFAYQWWETIETTDASGSSGSLMQAF